MRLPGSTDRVEKESISGRRDILHYAEIGQFQEYHAACIRESVTFQSFYSARLGRKQDTVSEAYGMNYT